MRKLSIFLTLTITMVLVQGIPQSFGHGLGFETVSMKFSGREIAITAELPSYFDEKTKKVIKINAFDKKEDKNAENVTFLVGLFHDQEMIFRNYFFTQSGDLFINVVPKEGEIEIRGGKDSLLGAFFATESQPIELVGPVFQSGGLYHFEIELRTIDEPTNVVDNLGVQIIDVSIVDTKGFTEQDKQGNDVFFKITSYFDKVSDLNYQPEDQSVSFRIPFDWNEKTISHIPVVHQEVHFSKDFAEFFSSGYTGQVNGIKLFKSNVVIDDYTDEKERIVHFVLLQDHLQLIKNELKKNNEKLPNFMEFTLKTSDQIQFPLSAMTKNEQFQIDLSWDPIKLETDIPTKFVFTIRDGKTGEPLRQSSYDFVIMQNNEEIYRNSGKAQVGGDFEQFTFGEKQTGPTIIRFENIRDSGLSTEFGIVVVPEFQSLVLVILFTGLVSVIALRKFALKI